MAEAALSVAFFVEFYLKISHNEGIFIDKIYKYMQTKIRTRDGFIQIPILITIIAGLFVAGGVGYFWVKRDQGHVAEEPQKEIVLQNEKATGTEVVVNIEPEIQEVAKQGISEKVIEKTATKEMPMSLPISQYPAVQAPVLKPQPVIISQSAPVTPSKTLRVYPDKSEFWASGFHYVNFGFEYLVDGKPINTIITLKNVNPSVPSSPIGISTDKKYSFSTKTPGNYVLTFATDTGVRTEVTVSAKEWINKDALEIVPIKTSNTIEAPNTTSYVVDIPTVFIGSFKIRSNPDIDFRLHDCSLSTNDPNITFSSFKVTGIADGDNNCFFSTGYTVTDNTGLSVKEFNVYVNDLKVSYINNPGSIYKFRFYLKDLVIREGITGIFHNATSSLVFDLEVLRYR